MTQRGKAIVRDSQVDDEAERLENSPMAGSNSRANPGAPLIHNRARWARRAAFLMLFVATSLDSAAMIVALSRRGMWRFSINLPIIVPFAACAGVVSLVGIVFAIVRLTKQRPTDLTMCVTLGALIVTLLASLIIVFMAVVIG